MAANIISLGSYKNHTDWVTSIAATSDLLISASRDKKLCLWGLNRSDQTQHLIPRRILTGHNHIIQNICLSSDGQYAISASWDKTLRLWDLNARKTIAHFVGHKDDVLSVSLSRNNRQIISSSRDKTIKLWNIYGECKYTTPELPEWVTAVKFGLADDNSPIVSAGYDRLIRVWDRTTFAQKYALKGHTGFINTIAISPDCSLVASGGRDTNVNMSDIPTGTFRYALSAGDVVNDLCFAPNRLWLAVATDSGVKIFDLNKKAVIVDLKLQQQDLLAATEYVVDAEAKAPKSPKALSLSFSPDGMSLYAGFSDGYVRCWNIPVTQQA